MMTAERTAASAQRGGRRRGEVSEGPLPRVTTRTTQDCGTSTISTWGGKRGRVGNEKRDKNNKKESKKGGEKE